MQLLRDPPGRLSLADVAFGSEARGFVDLPGPLGLGYTPDVAWLRVAIDMRAARADPLLIDIVAGTLSEILIYVPRVGVPRSVEDFKVIRLGNHVPFSERPMIGPSHAAELDLPTGVVNEVYLRVSTTSNLTLRASLFAPAAMATRATKNGVVFGIFEAVLVFTALLNLVFWNRMRETAFLWHGAFCASVAVLFCGINGLLSFGVLPPILADRLRELAFFAGTLTGQQSMWSNLDFARNFPVLVPVSRLLVALTLAGMAGTVLGFAQTYIGPFHLIAIIIVCVGLVCQVILAARGSRPALAAVLGILALLIGVLGVSLRVNGLLASSIVIDHAFEISMVVYAVYLTVAIAMRAEQAEELRLAAQEHALSVSQTAERDAQVLVAQRTHELSAAKEKAEAALDAERESQLEQVRFVDVISHQYRTPLSVVAASTQAIGLTLPPDDTANQERIGRISKALERLVQIVDMSLHRSRLDGASASPNLRRVLIGDTIRQSVEHARGTCGERQIDLDIEGEASHTETLLDPDMLDLAIVNLIENADKFSAPGKPVLVVCRLRDGALLELEVRDEGCGIPAHDLPQLTQKFFRASNSANTLGMGLGLHLVASIAKVHGGTVEIESDEGLGTRVTLRLPLASSQ
jgi:signal transduction histidine kinase